MKTKLISIFRPALYIVLGLSLAFACQKINPLDGVELTVNNDVYISPILVRAVNADVNAQAQPTNAVATISGPDANFVVDDLGNKSVTMVDGVLTLNLLPDANPSDSKPITFNIYVTCPGFVASNQTIRVTDNNETLNINIPMVSITAPPKGVTVAQQTTSLASGIIKSTIQVTAPTGNSKTENASISIPSGTQMQDINGNVINSNSLNIQVTHFGTTSTESVQAFPGGFVAENAITADGQKQAVTFETAGFVAIDMDAGGKSVKKFSNPINVSVGVNNELINPTTNIKIKEGDTVPVWSLNGESGQWIEEGIATIKRDENGNLVAGFQAKHLSCWNLDWSWPYFGSFKDCANAKLKINVKSNRTQAQAVSPYEVQIQTIRGQYLAGLHGQEMYEGLSLTIPRMPAISQAKIIVYNTTQWPYKIVGETEIFNPCSKGSIQVSINDPLPPTPITLKIDFQAKCSNKNVIIRPSQWIYFKEEGVIQNKSAYLRSGQTTIRIKEGVQYTVSGYYGGKLYKGVGKFSKSGSTFTPIGVSGITGTISYDAASNTATLKAVYTSNSCK